MKADESLAPSPSGECAGPVRTGRELDVEIAKKVFGARVWFRVDAGVYIMTRCSPHRELPAYSTDIAAAWQVVEKMRARGWWLLLKSPFTTDCEWFAGFTPDGTTGWNGRPDYYERANTAPLAICLAAIALASAISGDAPEKAQANSPDGGSQPNK